MEERSYWVFANKEPGAYGDSDWDMSTILDSGRYYFRLEERTFKKSQPFVQVLFGIDAKQVRFKKIIGCNPSICNFGIVEFV